MGRAVRRARGCGLAAAGGDRGLAVGLDWLGPARDLGGVTVSPLAFIEGARATAEAIGSSFAEAVAKARGNPVLKAGKPVSVSLVAAPFAGRVFDRTGHYTLAFVTFLAALAVAAAINGWLRLPRHEAGA